MNNIVIIDGIRTPYAKVGTALKDITADALGALVIKEIVARTGIDPERVDEVIVGNAGMPAETANIGRVIALRAGIPQRVPAYSVQRNCASGMQAAASAYAQIAAGLSYIVVVAGVESMSNFGFYTTKRLKEIFTRIGRSKTLWGKASAALSIRPKDLVPVVGLTLGLTDPVSGLNMGQTAENLARDFGITRREQDEFALLSHKKWTAANEAGKFRNEIVTIYAPPKFEAVEEDVGPRKHETLEDLERLRPYFDKQYGTVTPGNSSPITDGGAAALIMGAEQAKKLGYDKPLGRIKAFAFAGNDPSRMGLGPVFSTHKVLKLAGMTIHDIELIELNEAFAAQVIACEKAAVSKEFFRKHLPGEEPIGELRRDIMNVNGGAIAVGHPVGSSGLRIVITLLKEMERRGLSTGLATMCIGGGQGGAMIVERL
ncbi:MAG: thiolase family protein [Nitrospirae bacterium]|nr:thiolase family protein [Nitrospirota bacterium]NTW67418.1 thiolase family protein [Nitrospirota bacterium]